MEITLNTPNIPNTESALMPQKAPASPVTLLARVLNVIPVSKEVRSIELGPARPDELFPTFTAGAHIDLQLPSGIIRSYSLHNSQSDIGHYAIGVRREPHSRGGSSWLHTNLHIGDEIRISPPRNNFRLVEEAPRSVFVSGGIGITPLISMIRRVKELGGDAHILYCARSKEDAPFHSELRQIVGNEPIAQYHFSTEAGSNADIESYLSNFKTQDHFYCCGPIGMMTAFEAACETLKFSNFHVEHFRPIEQLRPTEDFGQCIIDLAKSKRTLTVSRDASILQCLISAGVDVQYSCEEGVCGACETRVLSGEVEHRDSILNKAQKATNQVMMICVSRCKSDRLSLDL